MSPELTKSAIKLYIATFRDQSFVPPDGLVYEIIFL